MFVLQHTAYVLSVLQEQKIMQADHILIAKSQIFLLFTAKIMLHGLYF